MKAVVAAFNQEKALVGAFSVITNLRMDLSEALLRTDSVTGTRRQPDINTEYVTSAISCHRCQRSNSAATPISQDLKLSAVHVRPGGYLTVAILCMNGTATA